MHLAKVNEYPVQSTCKPTGMEDMVSTSTSYQVQWGQLVVYKPSLDSLSISPNTNVRTAKLPVFSSCLAPYRFTCARKYRILRTVNAQEKV